jgi:hypothetical protein
VSGVPGDQQPPHTEALGQPVVIGRNEVLACLRDAACADDAVEHVLQPRGIVVRAARLVPEAASFPTARARHHGEPLDEHDGVVVRPRPPLEPGVDDAP